jgi:hypothetical protein
MTSTTTDKKVAAQFSKVAKVKALTEQLRDAYGTSLTRKDLKEFEKRHKLVVQWVARREEPAQKFRTPLGFVRPSGARGWYQIPTVVDSIVDSLREPTVLVNESGTPVTVTAPDFVALNTGTPLSADEQAVASMLGLEQDKVAAHKDSTGV